MTDEERLRLFVAIEIPDAWKEALGELQERMKAVLASDPRTAGARIRWVRPEGIHVTLKFIGEVAPDRLETIKQQMGHAVVEPPGMSLSPYRAGTFTDRRSPRVVWVGLHSQPEQSLIPLAQGIETWLAAADIPRERRGFRPHLTLARLPNEMTDTQRQRAATLTTSVIIPEMAPFRVEKVSLMRSLIQRGGARYERLGAWPD